MGINNAQPSYSLDINGSQGFSIEDQGTFSSTQTLSATTSIWKLSPTTAPVTCYVPAPADNEGRVLRVLNVSASYALMLKTVGNGNFAGTSNGSLSLNAKKHVTLLCDGTSWWAGQ